MSFSGNTGSGNNNADNNNNNKKGKGKSPHPVHTESSWRSNTKAEVSTNAGNAAVQNTNAATTANDTSANAATAPPIALPPRAPPPEIEFEDGCTIFHPPSAAYGRNQARRTLARDARDRPDAWISDLVKTIWFDAENRRGAFTKTAVEEGRDDEIYRWKDEGLNEVKLGLIANAPDMD